MGNINKTVNNAGDGGGTISLPGGCHQVTEIAGPKAGRTHIVLVILFILTFLSACATSFDSKGRYHRVQKRESLAWIAKSYGVSLQEVAELNGIENHDAPLQEGQKLYLPGKKNRGFKRLPFQGALRRHIEGPKEDSTQSPSEIRDSGSKIHTDHRRFDWPIQGAVLSPFGIRNGRRHDGIDIKGAAGTPIHAAGEGRVVFSGQMRGYGNLILVRHADDYFTAYAHNRVNKVKEGMRVKRGQVIALVGRTGRATGPHLHFEVREKEKARNPLFFLPVVR